MIANGDLLKSRVRNFGLLSERRIVFRIGIVYETPLEQIREVPRIIESAIRTQPKARFDRAHVRMYVARPGVPARRRLFRQPDEDLEDIESMLKGIARE